MNSGDTIAAISSAVGPAARMIVRTSGPQAWGIAAAICSPGDFQPGSASRVILAMNDLHLPAWVYAFAGPHSYTGEDLIEYHLTGNPILARMLLDDLIRRGARLAEAGEFTARAYFNGRIDLAAAEGIAAMIGAQSERELRAARQLMGGELAHRLRPIMDLIAQTLALIEVGIDFSEEDVSFLSHNEIRGRVARADDALRQLVEQSARFERICHEPNIVLVGRPNAGKSTLLNVLAGRERAVVSAAAGTTRDALSAEAALERGIVRLTDVAGLEMDVSLPQDPSPFSQISRQMQALAIGAVETADLVVLVRDITDSRPPPNIGRSADLVVLSKADLIENDISSRSDEIAVSAQTGWNLDILRARLDDLAFGDRGGGEALALNARHLQAIAEAREALARVGDTAAELTALELREALDALGRILGDISPDDLLGRIFSSFCIGK